MTIEQKKTKLLEWYPWWNVDKFTDEQVTVIYDKERNKLVDEILAQYS